VNGVDIGAGGESLRFMNVQSPSPNKTTKKNKANHKESEQRAKGRNIKLTNITIVYTGIF